MSILDIGVVRITLVAILAIAGLAIGLAGSFELRTRRLNVLAATSAATWLCIVWAVQRNSDQLQRECHPEDARCVELADMDRYMIPLIMFVGWMGMILIGHGIRFLVQRRQNRRTVGSSRPPRTDQSVWPKRPDIMPRKRQ